ncbi:MAG: recombinase family protein [Dehalococcoidia bacterium]|nr:MAG: recombinase family protein [Dehalococcoidia bacterium]
MRAVGYFRETSGSQPLAEQSRAFLDFCRQNGYEAAATFLDPAAGDDCTGYRQLIEFLKQRSDRGFTVVVIPSLTSLGSDLWEAARRYFQLVSLGVKVMCLEDGADPGATLLSLWSEKKDERLGQKVQAAMRRKAVKGEVLGRPPFGYRVGPRRRLEILPEEAAVVRYIFRLYLRDGLGIRLIARRLNEEGVRTHRDGLWSMVTVRDILRNRSYLGTYSRFGVRVPASHPALISSDDFRRVQERLSSRRQEKAKRQTSLFLLSGLAYCGYCDNKMIGVSRRQRWRRRDGTEKGAEYRYYQCESRTNRSLCDYHTRRAGQLEEEVRQALLGNKSSAVVAVPKAGDDAALLKEAEARCRRLRGRLRRLDKRLEEYMNEAARGRISGERMRSLSVDVAAEGLSLEESLAEAERFIKQQASAAERQQQKERALARLRDEWDQLAPLGQQSLLGELLERVVVWDDSIRVLLRL